MTPLQQFKAAVQVGTIWTCEAYADGVRAGVDDIPLPTPRTRENVQAYNEAVLALPTEDNVKVWESTGEVTRVQTKGFARLVKNRHGEMAESWGEWPKAKELHAEDGRFTVDDGFGRRTYFQVG